MLLPRQQSKLARGAKNEEHAISQTLNYSVAVIGIDIGKNSFHAVGMDARGAIVLRQKWSRGQIEARLAGAMGVVHHAEPLAARDPTVHIVPRIGDIAPKDADADCHQYPENNLQHLFALSAWLLASLREAAASAAWRCWRRRAGLGSNRYGRPRLAPPFLISDRFPQKEIFEDVFPIAGGKRSTARTTGTTINGLLLWARFHNLIKRVAVQAVESHRLAVCRHMPPPNEDARAGGARAKFGRFPQPRIAGAVAL